MKQLVLMLSAIALALGAAVAQAQPVTAGQTAQDRSDRDAATAKWAAMTPAEKDAVTQTMLSKRIADLSHIEKHGENDMLPMSRTATAKEKAEHDATQAKWAAMTPDEKTAVNNSAQQKRLAQLNTLERVGQEDSMARYMGN